MPAPGQKGVDCTPLPRIAPADFLMVDCCAAAGAPAKPDATVDPGVDPGKGWLQAVEL
jgi:hypothetical protein